MKKENLLITIGASVIGIIILGFIFDANIVLFLSTIRNTFILNLLYAITVSMVIALLFSILTVVFSFNEQKRRWVIPFWITLGATVVINSVIKFLVQRPRPYQEGIVNIAIEKAVEYSHSLWNFSFPSSRTAIVFSVLPLIWKHFPRFRYVWLVYAALIGFSRIYFGVHYLTDVIFGVIIGLGIGYFILYIEQKNRYSQKLLRKIS